ncbi:MAG: L-glutamate gamma-semialdehyde dehydrogenase [Deltaproteobacteria bacterium]|nr:L-glutamate gamma-semialdehyde dehydrogenase [Deltaproteobacteria bacterium]
MSTDSFEDRVKARGLEIFRLMKEQTASIFDRKWWMGKLMDWCLGNEALKVQMFRFIDVLPTLRDHKHIARHLEEYFVHSGLELPAALEWGMASISSSSIAARLASREARRNVSQMAAQFIVGADPADALKDLRKIWDAGMTFTVDLLGEAVVSETETDVVADRYMDLLVTLSQEMTDWPGRDSAREAFFPKVNVSIKLSSLYSQINPADIEGAVDVLKGRLRPLFRKARELGAFITLDMEMYAIKDLTLAVFSSLMEEEEFRGFPHAGIVIQTYLKDTPADLRGMIRWARRLNHPLTIRLVKGAYWDYETVLALQRGWPIPVFTDKWHTDRCFEASTKLLLENHDLVTSAFGSHNVRSIAHAMVLAEDKGVPQEAYEFQMLYGMAEPIKAVLLEMGYHVREYSPIGEILPGMAYLVRRLLENTSNESFLRQRFAEGAEAEELLRPPSHRRTEMKASKTDKRTKPDDISPFANEPAVDFGKKANREAMRQALQQVRQGLGEEFPLIIDGREVKTGNLLISTNPAREGEVVGRVHQAGSKEVEKALHAARKALPAWRDMEARSRAEVLFKAAALMRDRRMELASLAVYEVSKTWAEADADVAEAIDFCKYYGREMIRLGKPMRLGREPGEINHYLYQPRGIAAVMSPWNFPLAIAAGMVSAALVTGNCAVFKPSSRAAVTGAYLARILLEAGAPPGVLAFLPGPGKEVGEHLVKHPEVAMIAFTGSMEVGLRIIRLAGDTREGQMAIKRVVAEMGGKNAIIVDSDADLDEAIQGVIASAFGYQGQKCSACSRVIVLEDIHDHFAERLVKATRSLRMGPPEDPGTRLAAIIDGEAERNIRRYIKLGRSEGKLLLEMEAPGGGHFVGPVIFDGIRPGHRLAQEEIFGPVLSIMTARDFEEALEMANSTRYALTGGVYSRSPGNIQLARRGFMVGNLYINRKITGALVHRQPFGGFRMSGVGSKAGGPDYLLQFMEPRSITENTMRRGFAPVEEE